MRKTLITLIMLSMIAVSCRTTYDNTVQKIEDIVFESGFVHKDYEVSDARESSVYFVRHGGEDFFVRMPVTVDTLIKVTPIPGNPAIEKEIAEVCLMFRRIWQTNPKENYLAKLIIDSVGTVSMVMKSKSTEKMYYLSFSPDKTGSVSWIRGVTVSDDCSIDDFIGCINGVHPNVNHDEGMKNAVDSLYRLADKTITNKLSANPVFVKLYDNQDCELTSKRYSLEQILEDIRLCEKNGIYVKWIELSLCRATPDETVIAVNLIPSKIPVETKYRFRCAVDLEKITKRGQLIS